MKKKVYLVCNAHIDPIWQWEWEEGASSALSTFQSAANLLEEYDYIFNHNEVLLYKYIEEYSPNLFTTISNKIDEGKWNVMGGWYLQPDCLIPSGEGIVRQIQTGKEYFEEKFNKFSKTAINFDAFGHSRGIVQIVNKCGQNGYIFMRPFNWFTDPKKYQLELPDEQFVWEGYDGSTIKAARCSSYNSGLGHSLKKIKNDIKNLDKYESILSTWGVGNHGGGPSRIDLQDIKDYQDGDNEYELIHSTPDMFFDAINPTTKYDKSLLSCMVGCYTSMIDLKQKYKRVENELFFTEKMCSLAELRGAITYPTQMIKDAVEDILNVQFHDVICGTTVRAGEENALNFLGKANNLLNKARAKAIFGLISGEKVAEEGTYPIFVFNPKTYECTQRVEGEACFLMPFDFDNANCAIIDIYDENNNLVTSQNIKEESTIAMEWRKRFIFEANLKPMSVTRFTAKYHATPKADLAKPINKDVFFENKTKKVHISAKTGLLDSYVVNGVEYCKGNLFEILMLDDYEDPWGMNYTHVGTNPRKMPKMEKPHGIFDKLSSFEVVEDGPIFIAAESFFELDNSQAHVLYRIYKNNNDVDVFIDILGGDANKAYKAHLPLIGKEFSGEEMFGYESLFEDGKECIAHNYLTLKEDNDEFIQIITPTTYGSSYKDGAINITLFRTPQYCTHPTTFGPLTPENVYVRKIDAGMKSFCFRLTLAKQDELKKNADIFIEKPYAINIFPTKEKDNKVPFEIRTDNSAVNVVTIKKSDQKNGYVFRLQNNNPIDESTVLSVGDKSIDLHFGKYEVKTVLYNRDEIVELKEMII